MKKIITVISCLTISTNIFAFSLQHKHRITQPRSIKTTEMHEDFSGVWTGTCGSEEFGLKIRHEENQITIAELEHEEESLTFKFGVTSNSNGAYAPHATEWGFKFATYSPGEIDLIATDVSMESHGNSFSQSLVNMDLSLLKNEDTLTIESGGIEYCTLKKNG